MAYIIAAFYGLIELVPFVIFYTRKDDLKESCYTDSNLKTFNPSDCKKLIDTLILSSIISLVIVALFSVSN